MAIGQHIHHQHSTHAETLNEAVAGFSTGSSQRSVCIFPEGLVVLLGQKKAVQAFAQEQGESVTALIWGLLQDAMGVDKTAEGPENL